MKLRINRVLSQNAPLLNTGMMIALTAEVCGGAYHSDIRSHIVGGLPRDMYFGVVAKDVDIVVYGPPDWAVLNGEDGYFDALEDQLDYRFDGDWANMTNDTSESASSQPDNDRVYRVYACGKGLVNIIFYQGCYSLDDVIAKFDNTINAFWVDQVGASFHGLHYAGTEVTAKANPARFTTPERDQRMREKAAMFGLRYQDPLIAMYGAGAGYNSTVDALNKRTTTIPPILVTPYGKRHTFVVTDDAAI